MLKRSNNSIVRWAVVAVSLMTASSFTGCTRWGNQTFSDQGRPVGMQKTADRWNTDLWGMSESAKQVERNLGVR
jgi:hypothetical protein